MNTIVFKLEIMLDIQYFLHNFQVAYPLRIAEVHVINTHRLKTMSLLLLHLGLYPWRRKVVQLHNSADSIEDALGADRLPIDGLPYEYGGRAGAMKDLNGIYFYYLLDLILSH